MYTPSSRTPPKLHIPPCICYNTPSFRISQTLITPIKGRRDADKHRRAPEIRDVKQGGKKDVNDARLYIAPGFTFCASKLAMGGASNAYLQFTFPLSIKGVHTNSDHSPMIYFRECGQVPITIIPEASDQPELPIQSQEAKPQGSYFIP